MRQVSWLVSTLAALVFTASTAAAAQGTVAGSSEDRPRRGMSMENVEAKYGAPTKRVPAVGQPPITRWEYPGFTVYFEHHLVIHAVASAS